MLFGVPFLTLRRVILSQVQFLAGFSGLPHKLYFFFGLPILVTVLVRLAESFVFFHDGHCAVTYSVEVRGGRGKGILSSGCWDMTNQPGKRQSVTLR